MSAKRTEAPEEPQKVVVRDKRRVDPETGEAREPLETPAGSATDGTDDVIDPAGAPSPASWGAVAGPNPAAAVNPSDSASDHQRLLDERTADLQRVKAEFDNYRKRVERDRQAVGELATATVLAQLLPVLDDIDRAAEHGELSGGFKSVAEALQGALTRLGLERFGSPGDAFDPSVHEAVMHQQSEDVPAPTAVSVMRPGYLFRERLIRPAMVGVAEPASVMDVADEGVRQ